jgi:NAD+ kinase
MTIGIFANLKKAKLPDIIKPFLRWLEARNINILMTEELYRFISPTSSNVRAVSPEVFASQSDLIVAMGGDGTMLAAARIVGPQEKPLLGVNLGSLGFLAEVSVDELYPRMEKVLAGQTRIEKRMVIEAAVQKDKTIETFHALNDVVLDRGGSSRIIRIYVDVDGHFFNTFYSDGLIVSTPTGSTAYSLSAFGPIVVPTLESMILSPICSHSLTARPTVIPAASVVSLKLESDRHEALLSIDGQLHMAVDKNTRIEIHRAAHDVHWLTFDDHSFFDVLRKKLHWGNMPGK